MADPHTSDRKPEHSAAPTGSAGVDAHTEEAAAARRSSNLAFSFLSLNAEQREAMSIFYDFCRKVDDVADDRERADADKAAELAQWRSETTIACRLADDDTGAIQAGTPPLRYCAQMVPVIRRYKLREADLLALIDGVSMDIGNRRYETFDDLRQYCYGVASAVGLCCVRIFGCTGKNIDAFAEALGYALQFTNILRDVAEDYVEMGRVYLPQSELRAFGVNEADLADPANNPRCRRLFALCHYRASHFFAKARRLLPPEDKDKLKAAFVMEAFYRDILAKIQKNGFRISRTRTRLSKGRKFWLLLRSMAQSTRPVKQMELPCKAVVLGGGVAGASAAINLGAEGFTPVLCEARPQLGGRAHSFTDAATGITLDNAQHVIMGCYSAFIRFAKRLDIVDKFRAQAAISVPYLSQGGIKSKLQAAPLPSPLHLLSALIGFKAINWKDRLAILRLGLAVRFGGDPGEATTAAQWLQRHRQSRGAIVTLWEPFCLAALNTSLELSSARVFAETVRRSLLGDKDAAAIWIATVPLSELLEPQTEIYLRSIGGEVRMQCGIAELQVAPSGKSIEAAVTRKGERIEAGLFVSALQPSALEKLLANSFGGQAEEASGDAPQQPQQPAAVRSLQQRLAALQPSPILGIHMICETKLFDNAEGFVGLLESPLHWVFDRTDALDQARQAQGKRLYALVVSVAGDWLELSRDELNARVVSELARFFPDKAATLNPERIVTYKSLDATFLSTVQAERVRPSMADAPWNNLLLAGDWVANGLPGTLESAAESGELKAFLTSAKG